MDAPTSINAEFKAILIGALADRERLVREVGEQQVTAIWNTCNKTADEILTDYKAHKADDEAGLLLLFDRPIEAVRYSQDLHRRIMDLSQEHGTRCTLCMGIHFGEVAIAETVLNEQEAISDGPQVEGLAKLMAARISALAKGGQTLLSKDAFELARQATEAQAGDQLHWLAHGTYYYIKGKEEPLEVFEVGLSEEAPFVAPAEDATVRRLPDGQIAGWRPGVGQEIPNRYGWKLRKKLGEGGFGETWLSEHLQTQERRVFKFCFDSDRLNSLRREITIFRLLQGELGYRNDITKILEWNLEEYPYYIESEYTNGGNLEEWAQEQGGLHEVPLILLVDIIAQIAEALAAAHSASILHRDIKPQNILIQTNPDERVQAQLVDFGIGRLTDDALLVTHGMSFGDRTGELLMNSQSRVIGTQMYIAPERIEGRQAGFEGDVYSLGVVLYQCAIRDFSRTIAPGWEHEVNDRLLRSEIASAVAGRPDRRATAELLASRLRSFAARKKRVNQSRLVGLLAVLSVMFASLYGVNYFRNQALRDVRATEMHEVLIGNSILDNIGHEADEEGLESSSKLEVSKLNISAVGFLEDIEFNISLLEDAKNDASNAEERKRQARIQYRLQKLVGWIYMILGEYEESEFYSRSALENLEFIYGPHSPRTASALNLLTRLYLKADDLESAHSTLSRTASLRFSHDDVQRLLYLTHLASFQGRNGEYQSKVETLEEALAVDIDDNNIEGMRARGTALQNLGNAYLGLGQYDDAIVNYTESEGIYGEYFAQDEHYRLAGLTSNFGAAFWYKGEYHAAEQKYRKSLQLYKKALGSQDLGIIIPLNNLGEVLVDRREYCEAKNQYEKALDLAETRPRSARRISVLVHAGLARLFTEGGKWALATRHAEEAMRTADEVIEDGGKKVLGEKHPDRIVVLRAVANLKVELQLYEEAESALTRALQLCSETHPDYVWISCELGNLYRKWGKLDKSEASYEDATQRPFWEDAEEWGHPRAGLCLLGRADLATARGDNSEAEISYRQGSSILQRSLASPSSLAQDVSLVEFLRNDYRRELDGCSSSS